MKKIFLVTILLILKTFTWGTNSVSKVDFDTTLINDEKRIAIKVNELIAIRFDDAKMEAAAADLLIDFEQVLKKQGAFDYPFDSISSVGKVVSKDGLVRIFTWYSIKANGDHVQYGFLQYYQKADKEVLLYPLIDKSDEIEDPQVVSLTNKNWYGATYYEILQSKSSYGKLYVLLGWDGCSIYLNKKVVESLVFTESGRPKFGKPVFVSSKSKVKRIIFEYSRMASMMLNYNEEFDMIVMDHLSPSNPIYNGNTQFYGPDFSYDGLKFEDGYWVYKPTINYKPKARKRSKK